MSGIEGLGHVGIHTFDLMKMRDFYTRVLGLQITDENLDPGRGIIFLSADPDYEHHEFVLVGGKGRERDVSQGANLIQQISFKVSGIDAIKEIHRRIQVENLKVDRFVSHGILTGIVPRFAGRRVGRGVGRLARHEFFCRRGRRGPFRRSLDGDVAGRRLPFLLRRAFDRVHVCFFADSSSFQRFQLPVNQARFSKKV